MICSVCGADKVPYEFPLTPNKPLTCFDCNGLVECVCCGEKKNPLAYRVMGKICTPCKIATNMRLSGEQIKRYEQLTGQRALNTIERAKRRETAK